MATATWLPGYTRQVELIVASGKMGSAQNDFTALVTGANLPAVFWTSVTREDLGDLRVTDAAGTIIRHEIVSGSRSNQTAEVYLKPPTLDVGSAVYLQWGHASNVAPNIADQQAAWHSSYIAGWHCNESAWNGTPNEVRDFTPNGMSGVRAGNATTQSGMIGRCGTFDGSDDWVATPGPQSPASFTVECLCQFSSGRTNYRPLICANPTSSTAYPWFLGIDPSLHWYAQVNRTGGSTSGTSTLGPTTGTTYHVALTYNAATAQALIRVNGANVLSVSGTTGTAIDITAHRFGGYQTGARSWNGLIDEVRLSDALRAPDYLDATWRNLTSPASFWTTGAVVAAGGVNPYLLYGPRGSVAGRLF